MAEVHIRDLHCVKRQDAVGKDRAYLQINGRTIAGPFSMGTGDHVWVNVKEGFTGEEVFVTLMEEDACPDDNLGTARTSTPGWSETVFRRPPSTRRRAPTTT